MTQSSRSAGDDEIRTECIIAAILTIAVLGGDGSTPQFVVGRYAATIQELRKRGGYSNPIP
jgi:hypothetical protein